MLSTDQHQPIIHNAGTFYLQPRSISVKTVQTPSELNTQHIYAFNASNNLPLGIIPSAVNHKISHKYPKSLSLPVLNTAYDRVCIPRATVFGTLNLIEIESTEVSNISWTKTEKITRPHHKLSNRIPNILLEYPNLLHM